MVQKKLSAWIVGLVSLLAAVGAAGQRPPKLAGDCDGLHEVKPPFEVTDNGGTEARARRDFHLKADSICTDFCQTGKCDPATVKCKNLQGAVGAALTTHPKCKQSGKTFECKGAIKYCPCACETGAPTGNLPRTCAGEHEVSFAYPIRGKGKTDGDARSEMKEMARSACEGFCARIGCDNDDPCILDGEVKLDPPDGTCENGSCEATLTKCKCKCGK